MTDQPKKSFKNYDAPDFFGKFLGYEVVSADFEKNETTTAVSLSEKHLSSAGRVHGGVVSAFMDFALAASVFTTLGEEDFTSTVELKVNYLRPVSEGDRLIAETDVVFRGKKLCVTKGIARRESDGKEVAMATGTYNVVSKTGH
jgi:uncharacterized protein (TIGR00369 family)